MTRSESKYEKLLKEKYYPDPVIFEKEKKRIIDSIKTDIPYYEKEIDSCYNRATVLRSIIVESKQKLDELS